MDLTTVLDCDLTEQITYISLRSINIALHGFGLYLLVTLYKQGEKSSQRLYLLNLSFAELLQNFFSLVIHSLRLTYKLHPSRVLGRTITFLIYVINTGVGYQYFASMFLLLGDRLLCTLLGLRYPIYWNFRKTITTITCTWVCNVLVSVAASLHVYVSKKQVIYGEVNKIMSFYVPTTLFATFLIFSIFSYSVMFYKFLSSRRRTSGGGTAQPSALYIFTHSKFFICIILVSTFLILMVIPTSIGTLSLIIDNPLSRSFDKYLHISVILSDTADVFIYVFLQPSVRKLLLKHLSSVFQTISRLLYAIYSGINAGTEDVPVRNLSINVPPSQRDNERFAVTTWV